MPDENLENIYDKLNELHFKKSNFYWDNPEAPSSPFDDEIKRLRALMLEGVQYEPRF